MPMTKETMDDGMEDLYEAPETEEKSKPESVDQEEQEAMAHKAVVPQAVLKSGPEDTLKVGDERVVKVVALNGDEEATVIYAPAKKGEEEEGKSPEQEGMGGEEMSADEEIDSMDKY